MAACRPADSVEEWIKRADLALYRAKINGRNQVKVEDLEGSVDNFMCGASRSLLLQWSKTYECGHAEIDQQHRNLFARANELLQMNGNNADKEHIALTVKALLEETIAHFKYEEHILEKIGHPDASAHAQSHQRLLEKTNILFSKFQRGGAELTALLHFMIYELTAQHIMIDDRCFGKINISEPEATTQT